MKDEKGKGASFHCDWSRWIQIAVDGAVELLIAPGTELKGEHTGRFIFDEYLQFSQWYLISDFHLNPLQGCKHEKKLGESKPMIGRNLPPLIGIGLMYQ